MQTIWGLLPIIIILCITAMRTIRWAILWAILASVTLGLII